MKLIAIAALAGSTVFAVPSGNAAVATADDTPAVDFADPNPFITRGAAEPPALRGHGTAPKEKMSTVFATGPDDLHGNNVSARKPRRHARTSRLHFLITTFLNFLNRSLFDIHAPGQE